MTSPLGSGENEKKKKYQLKQSTSLINNKVGHLFLDGAYLTKTTLIIEIHTLLTYVFKKCVYLPSCTQVCGFPESPK